MKVFYGIASVFLFVSGFFLGYCYVQMVMQDDAEEFPSDVPDGMSSWYSPEYGFMPENYSGFLPYPYWEHPTK